MSAYIDKDNAFDLVHHPHRQREDRRDLKDDAHVNLAFADSPRPTSYVSVTGTARVVRDPAKTEGVVEPVRRSVAA